MKVVPLSPEGLRIGRPLPFTVRDGTGLVLLARGASILNDKQLTLLRSRPLFIDMSESEVVQRAVNGQWDQLFLQDVALGRIAQAKPDYDRIATPAARAATPEPAPDWPNLQMRLRLLLADAQTPGWLERLRQTRDDILSLVQRNPDRALLRLFHDAGTDFQEYSGNHSLLVCVLVSLTCSQLPGWDAAWHEPLTLAALTMNLGFTQLQDELTRQAAPPSDAQQAALLSHPARAAALLEQAGVSDPLWLHAVRHHHDAVPGPMAGRGPADLLARLVRRTDRYAARLSPRKSRPASSAATAAQAALLDEGGHADDAGQALIRTLGLYPPGTWVRLACDEVALVVRRTAVAKAPMVVSLVAKTGLPMAVPAPRNTRLPSYEVTGAVAPAQVKVRPPLDQLEKLA